MPRSRIHVVTVPPKGSPHRTLVDRFFAAVGIDAAQLDVGEPRTNAALDWVQAELLRRLTAATAGTMDLRAQRRLINKGIVPRLRPADPAYTIPVPPSALTWVNRETLRRIEGLKTSGCVLHGDLDDLRTAASTSGRLNGDAAVTDATLLGEALSLIAALADQPPDFGRI